MQSYTSIPSETGYKITQGKNQGQNYADVSVMRLQLISGCQVCPEQTNHYLLHHNLVAGHCNDCVLHGNNHIGQTALQPSTFNSVLHFCAYWISVKFILLVSLRKT